MSINASEPVPVPNPPTPRPPQRPSRSSPRPSSKPPPTSSVPPAPFTTSSSTSSAVNYSSSSSYRLDSSTATASSSSASFGRKNLRDTLPSDNPHIYDFAQIRSATNNFLSKRHSPTSWRCTLNNKDVVIFQRKSHKPIDESNLKKKLQVICKSHHLSIIKLLGASVSGDHIYLVYEYVQGTNLSLCLRNPHNPNFTVLSTWMSRMQIATDMAHALDYIHHNTGLNVEFVHKHVKSSAILITEPLFHARICHFGAAELCGETENQEYCYKPAQFEGVRGYMSPEFQETGVATQMSDVFAFGVVLLELLTGEEPVKFKYDRESNEYRKISIVETAKQAVASEEDGGVQAEGKVRRWVDKRLRDSFPVEVVEKLTRLALECVHVNPHKRPDMRYVTGKISKLYLQSKAWSQKVQAPTEISVSLAPR